MDSAQVRAYLDRIGLQTTAEPTVNAAGLALLQAAHLRTVPFENMDIVEGRVPLALDEESLFQKIVVGRRGGICYEINLTFSSLLRALGFDVSLRGGRHPKYGDDMDHLFMLVNVEDCDVPLIADAGFAYNFACPLRLEIGVIQDDGRDRYRIDTAEEVGPGYLRLYRIAGQEGEGEESELYTFGPREVSPADCRERCDWYSTSPQSRFTQGPLVCLDGENARYTLSANHFITTSGADRQVQEITSTEQFESFLRTLMP